MPIRPRNCAPFFTTKVRPSRLQGTSGLHRHHLAFMTRVARKSRASAGSVAFAADATDIPRAAAVLAKRTWLKGHGYIKVSKSGQLLERCVLDTAVFQTNRIDYRKPAKKTLETEEAQTQHFGNARLLLDTKVALPELTAVADRVQAARFTRQGCDERHGYRRFQLHPRALCRIGGPGHS